MQEPYSVQEARGAGVPVSSCEAETPTPSAHPALCQTPHLDPFSDPFPNWALPFPPQVYEGGSHVDQFVTRFLLKETANQIQSLLSSVESAVEAIEEQTSQIRCVTGTTVSPGDMSHMHTAACFQGPFVCLGAGDLGQGATPLCASLSPALKWGPLYTYLFSDCGLNEMAYVQNDAGCVCITCMHRVRTSS